MLCVSAALAAVASGYGCRRGVKLDGDAGPPLSSSGATTQPAPGGADVVALLGGLQAGDVIEGYTVGLVGAVREDGAVAVELRRGRAEMRIVVTLAPEDDDPLPPARTRRYAVYYESPDRGPAARDEECQRVARSVAARIRAVEETVAVPEGMKEPRKWGHPA